MRKDRIAKLQDRASAAANLLKLVGNETRLQLLCQLLDGEKPVNELEQSLGRGQSAVSQHLAILRRTGLVRTRRAAQHIHYSLANPDAVLLLKTLSDIYCTDGRVTAAD